jgi:archaellin
MFNFGKKIEKDPQKALDNAKKTLNSGITGGLTKAFMGKDFVNDMNGAMNQGQAALDGLQQQQWLAQNGLEASADVIMVTDTGATVNMNPVVVIQMKVTPAAGAPFDVTTQTMVSRIAVPRAGDKIKIKYNPANPMQVAIL